MNDSAIVETAKFRVGGMDCASCARKIETAVARLPGVTEIRVSAATGRMIVVGGDRRRIEAEVAALGYSIAPHDDAAVSSAAHRDRANRESAARGGGDAQGCDHHEHAPHECATHEHSREHFHDHHSHDHRSHDHVHADFESIPWWRSPKARLTIICGIASALAYAAGMTWPELGNWPFLVALPAGLAPVALRAFAAARAGVPFSIETLVTIASAGAIVIGAAEEAMVVVLLFLIGELLEGVAAERARSGVSGLTRLLPDTALLDEGDSLREISAAALQPGAVIVIRAGDRIAADGEVIEGEGCVDEALVTGESAAAAKRPGDKVFAGTINGDALLRVRVAAPATENTVARIVRLVEEAQESKAPTERFIDRFSRGYTPAVLAAGALSAVVPPLLFAGDWSEWIYKSLAILLIGCPCALVISTPAAIAAGLSAGARHGLLLKGGAVLETLRRIDIVAFDKTGTLTTGRPSVTDIEGFGYAPDEMLTLAAALERGSNHPLARAIIARASGMDTLEAQRVRVLSGKGVEGVVNGRMIELLAPHAVTGDSLTQDRQARIAALNAEGKTVSVLIVDDQAVGLIAVRDELRADAAGALATLHTLGVDTLMLTGDGRRGAEAVAAELNIAVDAELLPEDKSRILRRLQVEGRRIAKVGDGVNDAPALATADVGIAMGGGADIALETADAAALHGRVSDIPAMIALSRATMRNIWQNITMAIGLKVVFLVTTVLGVTGLWPAVLADTGATVLVTANAMRLLAWKHPWLATRSIRAAR